MMSFSLPLVLFPSFLFLTKWKKFLTKLSQEEKTKEKKYRQTGQDRTGQGGGAGCSLLPSRRTDGSIPARLGSVRSCLAQRVLSLASRLASGHGRGGGSLPDLSSACHFPSRKKKKEKEREKEKKENFSLSLSVTLIRIVFIFQSSLPCQFLKAILSVFHSHEEAGLDVRVR